MTELPINVQTLMQLLQHRGAEIMRLTAENAKLREAVSWLANLDMDRFTEHDEALLEAAIEEARAALGGEND